MSTCAYAAKEPTVKTVIRSWQLPLPMLLADTVGIDTSMVNLPMRTPLDDYSISNVFNANFISPAQSRIYFDRKEKIEDIFGRQYEPYLKTGHNVQFYNTTVPYSKIAYKRGFTTYHEENEINFLFTGNLTKRLNLGTEINYLSGAGHYQDQQGKLFNGSVWGSYNGNHYGLEAAVTWNSLKNFENGGIRDTADINSSLRPEDIPTRMHGMSGYKYTTALLHHYYHLCKTTEVHDTIEVMNGLGEMERVDTMHLEYQPIITFAHTFDLNNSVRQYKEKSVPNDFYAETLLDPKATNDSTNALTLRNTITVTFEEAFNRLLRFGANVYAVNECQRYLQTHDSTRSYRWWNNTFVGGSIYKNQGNWIRYGVNGDVCLVGQKLGEFQVNGHVNLDFPIRGCNLQVNADAYVRSETPTFYQQNFVSNHFIWHNHFKPMFRYYVGGEVKCPTRWVKLGAKVNFENRQNYIYSDYDGHLAQSDKHIQILAAEARVDFTTPWIVLENTVVYQLSSSERLPLPTITLYHNLYYHGYWFKRAMEAQIGADFRYHTRYYAPLLNPATGQFQLQNDMLIGNYPVLNVYANFYVKLLHLKFFAQYTHINHLFMQRDTHALIMAGYPYNPDIFRAGLSFHFFK